MNSQNEEMLPANIHEASPDQLMRAFHRNMNSQNEEILPANIHEASPDQLMRAFHTSRPDRVVKGIQENLTGLTNDVQGVEMIPFWITSHLLTMEHSEELQSCLTHIEKHIQGIQPYLDGIQSYMGGLVKHIGGLQEQIPNLKSYLPDTNLSIVHKKLASMQQHFGGLQVDMAQLRNQFRIVEGMLWNYCNKRINVQNPLQDQQVPQKHLDVKQESSWSWFDMFRKTSSGVQKQTSQKAVKSIKYAKVNCHLKSSEFDVFPMIENHFLGKVQVELKKAGISLSTCSYNSADNNKVEHLLAFCLIRSRLGTDVDACRKEIQFKDNMDCILVVLHHIAPHERFSSAPTKNRLTGVSHSGFSNIYDIRCWKDAGGLYECPENDRATQELAGYITENWKPQGNS